MEQVSVVTEDPIHYNENTRDSLASGGSWSGVAQQVARDTGEISSEDDEDRVMERLRNNAMETDPTQNDIENGGRNHALNDLETCIPETPPTSPLPEQNCNSHSVRTQNIEEGSGGATVTRDDEPVCSSRVVRHPSRNVEPTGSEENYEEPEEQDYVFEDICDAQSDSDYTSDDCEEYVHEENSIHSSNHTFREDYVDQVLFEKYKAEANAIRSKLQYKLGVSNVDDVKPGQLLDLVLPEELVVDIVQFCNSALRQKSRDPTNCNEFRLCVAAYLRCGIYGASFADTFSEEETAWLGLNGSINVSEKRCVEVLQALSGPTPNCEGLTWELVSRESHQFLSRLEERICSINASLFLTENSILSIDDDHIRQRSRRVQDLTYLKVINNPKKALGPVQTACCSAFTGFYLGGHYSIREEQVKATFEKLFMYLQGAKHPDDICLMPRIVVACDRGYINNDTIRFILCNLGANIIGTHKRTKTFPFTYGKSTNPNRFKGLRISEKGGRAFFYARRMVRNTKVTGSRRVKLMAMAYREAVNGRIAMLVSSYPQFSTGWSSISAGRPKRRKDYQGEPPTNTVTLNPNITHYMGFAVIPFVDSERSSQGSWFLSTELTQFLSSLKCYTEVQSSCRAWFVLRAFRFTSRTTAGYLRCLRDADSKWPDLLTAEESKTVSLLYSSIVVSERADRERIRSEVFEQLRTKRSQLHTFNVSNLNEML